MHIFIFRKNILLLVLITSITISTFIFIFSNSFTQSISTSSDTEITMQEKINNLTKNKEKIAYLTFDDGPTLKATGKVLDILKEEEIKATFFVIGKYVKKHPELVKRAYTEGHYIANHGYNHNNKQLYSSINNFISEIKNTDSEIGNAIDKPEYKSYVFRFPNGYMSPIYKTQKKKSAEALNKMGYIYVDWNSLNKDSEKKISNQQLISNLKKSSKNKGTLIILMHDTCDVNNTPAVLKESINYLKNQGYTFHNFYDFFDP